MSTKKYASVSDILDKIISHYGLDSYAGLAGHLGLSYQTVMAWKKRNSIGDYATIMDKCIGVRLEWLRTGEGEMFRTAEAAQAGTGYAAAISSMVKDMDEDTQKDIYLSVQKEKLLRELLRERSEKKEAS